MRFLCSDFWSLPHSEWPAIPYVNFFWIFFFYKIIDKCVIATEDLSEESGQEKLRITRALSHAGLLKATEKFSSETFRDPQSRDSQDIYGK